MNTRQTYLQASQRLALLNQRALHGKLTPVEHFERERVRRIHDRYQGSLNHRWHLLLGNLERWYYRLPRWMRRG